TRKPSNLNMSRSNVADDYTVYVPKISTPSPKGLPPQIYPKVIFPPPTDPNLLPQLQAMLLPKLQPFTEPLQSDTSFSREPSISFPVSPEKKTIVNGSPKSEHTNPTEVPQISEDQNKITEKKPESTSSPAKPEAKPVVTIQTPEPVERKKGRVSRDKLTRLSL